MSFARNPYKAVTLETNDGSLCRWECDSCGGTGQWYSLAGPLWKIIADFRDHVRDSHKRTPEDFRGWSS
jgi:hypothetical protein